MDSARARAIIDDADTFLIASRSVDPAADTGNGLDVSHRGGRPGFVALGDDRMLSFPDFSGNRYFNTLGNIASDGRVGLVVPDFATGAALLLTGRARTVDVMLEETWFVEHALPATTGLVEASPGLERTGTWEDATSFRP